MSFVKFDQTERPISHQEMLDLANKFVLAIKSRSWELMKMIITKDIIWRWPGSEMISGTAIGVESVIKEISAFSDRIKDLQLNKISYGLTGVAVSLHFIATLNGKEVDEDLITVCLLRGYQIAGINTYLSDVDSRIAE
jgi:hypothetical protein